MTIYNYQTAKKLLGRIEATASSVGHQIAEHGKIDSLYEWGKMADGIRANLRIIDVCFESEWKHSSANKE